MNGSGLPLLSPIGDGTRRDLEHEFAGLVAFRLHQLLSLCLIAIALFAVFDRVLSRDSWGLLATVKLFQAVLVASAVLALRQPRSRFFTLAAGELAFAVLYVGTAVSGFAIRDYFTTGFVFTALAIGTSTYVPWGVGPQLRSLVAPLLSIAFFCGWASESGLTLPLSGLATLASVSVASVFIAWQTERQFLLAARGAKVERALEHSEARRAAVVAASLDAILVVDPDGKVVEFNPSAERIFGRSRESAVASDLADLVLPARLRRELRASLDEHLRTGRSDLDANGVELAALRADGSEFPAEFSVTRSLWQNGPILVVQIRDISARKRTETALRESEARLAAFFDTTNVPLCLVEIVGDDLVMVLPNRRLAEALGRRPADLAGTTARDAGMRPDDIRYWIAQLRRSAVSGPRRIPEYRLLAGDDERWFEVSVSPIWSDAGRPPQFSVAASEITERRRADERVKHLNLELEEEVRRRTSQLALANRELESFAYSVSHDLRTPLRSIEGFADILLAEHAGEVGEEGRGHLDRVRRAARRMAGLIDDLLTLSRVVRGEMAAEPVDMTALAREVAERLLEGAKGRRLEITIAPGMKAWGDPRLLAVAWENLLGNAIKYTARTESAHIEVGCVARGRESEFFVEDDGCGFDPEFAAKLFQPFSRLHGPADYEGNGIGLATVARIASRHGGSVGASGAVAGGARFWLRLPNEASHAERPPREIASA